jgi:hypothetical protein
MEQFYWLESKGPYYSRPVRCEQNLGYYASPNLLHYPMQNVRRGSKTVGRGKRVCALSFPRRKPHKGVSAHQFKSFGGIVTVDLCHI